MPAYTTPRFVAATQSLMSCDMSFREYVSETNSYWRILANYIYRRWPAGCGISVDDVYQEVLIGLWIAYAKCEEGEGKASASKYLYWNAGDKAKRFVHKQRGAIQHGKKDKNPSRLPVLFSQIGDDSNRFEESLPDATCLESILIARSEVVASRIGIVVGRKA